MKFTKKLTHLILSLFLPFFLEADSPHFIGDDVNFLQDKHCSSSSSCHCHDSVEVILSYKSPCHSNNHAKYEIFISLLTIDTENMITNKEIFRVVEGPNKKVRFGICMNPEQTLSAFAVSFDHDFEVFDSKDTGTFTAIINGVSFPIDLVEYEPNIAVGFFNLPAN